MVGQRRARAGHTVKRLSDPNPLLTSLGLHSNEKNTAHPCLCVTIYCSSFLQKCRTFIPQTFPHFTFDGWAGHRMRYLSWVSSSSTAQEKEKSMSLQVSLPVCLSVEATVQCKRSMPRAKLPSLCSCNVGVGVCFLVHCAGNHLSYAPGRSCQA